MSQSIPAGLTREHVLNALADLDTGIDHPFGPPTGYELIHDGKRYAPKAVVGLACKYATGQVLSPQEFSGGEGPGQANHVLRGLGFTVEGMTTPAPVAEERQHRRRMWESLLARGGSRGVTPGVLRELGVYGGAQGIWVDKARTGRIADDGVTVAVLHTGSTYADDLTDDCVLYHYPQTHRPSSRDAGEVDATKAAGRLRLPVFVVSYPTPNSPVRDVRLGWVEAWDDDTRTFLITFGDEPPEQPNPEDTPLVLTSTGPRGRREVATRPGQVRFQFLVFRRYGPRCCVCGLAVRELLDAAHLCPKAVGGTDDPRNGLVLCANHHRALDAGLYAIDPTTRAVCCRSGGPDRAALGITRESLTHLPNPPHVDALAWVWDTWSR